MTKVISRREFNELLGSSALAIGVGGHKALASENGDVGWTSDDPHLSGNYLPVEREMDVSNLKVISGRIPRGLSGAYMRNGPNPRFKPIYYAYPMDGDGMIHAVYFDNGQARYRNRFVRTSGFLTEQRAGRAIYGSLTPMTPVARQRYDGVTLALHAVLAVGVVCQLLLSMVMRVPAGVGLGVHDWHREAFEIHARVGLGVAAVCALHWLWFCEPQSYPGVRSLFPWTQRDQREILIRDIRNLLRFMAPPRAERSPLIGTVHGLGLVAVTGSSAGGIVNYLGYFLGAPVPTLVLHWVGRGHIALGYLIGLFIIGHGSMAVRHWQRRKQRSMDRAHGSQAQV